MNFVEFETALDEHRLWVIEYQPQGRKNYLVRRNGKTKLWRSKKNLDRWEIPIKWKLRNTARISNAFDLNAWFVIQPGPNGPLVGAELLDDSAEAQEARLKKAGQWVTTEHEWADQFEREVKGG